MTASVRAPRTTNRCGWARTAVGTTAGHRAVDERVITRPVEYWPYVFGQGSRQVLGGTTERPPSIVADAVAWLVSDEARFVTGALSRSTRVG
jgi:hypothetical protein